MTDPVFRCDGGLSHFQFHPDKVSEDVGTLSITFQTSVIAIHNHGKTIYQSMDNLNLIFEQVDCNILQLTRSHKSSIPSTITSSIPTSTTSAIVTPTKVFRNPFLPKNATQISPPIKPKSSIETKSPVEKSSVKTKKKKS